MSDTTTIEEAVDTADFDAAQAEAEATKPEEAPAPAPRKQLRTVWRQQPLEFDPPDRWIVAYQRAAHRRDYYAMAASIIGYDTADELIDAGLLVSVEDWRDLDAAIDAAVKAGGQGE